MFWWLYGLPKTYKEQQVERVDTKHTCPDGEQSKVLENSVDASSDGLSLTAVI